VARNREANAMRTTLLARPFSLAVTAALVALCAGGPARGQQFEWETATPKSQGMSQDRLHALRGGPAERKNRAFLVIRNDKVVYEWYAKGVAAGSKQGTASLAKAIVAGLSLAVLLTDGKISLDDKAAKYVPQWKDDPKKSRITVRHLGAHASG